MRNSSGELIENKLVKLRFSIIEGHVNGSKVYIETHSKNTDASGLISLQIGTGTISNGVFSSINWGKAPYFMQLEVDFSGGNNFVDLGTEELLSVPYSLYASKTDTTVLNLVNRFGLKLNVSDTASMMVNYRSALNRKVNNSDTASMLANYRTGINAKVNISDTAVMLSNYRIGLNNKLNISDTATMLAPYLRKVDAMNSPETDPIFGSSISKGITGTDTAYWNRKVNISDTVSMLSNYRIGLNSKAPLNNPTFTGTVSGIDKNMVGLGNVDNTSDVNKPISTATQSALNNKVNVSDTSSMLSNYRIGLNNKVNISDTVTMLAPYLRKVDAMNSPETDPIFGSSIAKGIKGIDTAYWNRKVNISDTASMFSNYRTELNNKVNVSDTSDMLANYRNGLNSKAPINNPTFTGTVSGIDKNMIGLGNVDNTSDANKPISTATQTALNNKVNVSDTSSMLSNYRTGLNNKVNVSDTSSMLNPYLRKSEIPLGTTLGNIQYWNGTTWVNLTPGLPGQSLIISSTGIPSWSGAALPTVITDSVSEISITSALVGGNVINDGGETIIERGIVYSTNDNPTLSDGKFSIGSGTGTFSETLGARGDRFGLVPNTTYYVRAFATNRIGTGYGRTDTFSTNNYLSQLPLFQIAIIDATISDRQASVLTKMVKEGNGIINEVGIVYSKFPNPTISDSKTIITNYQGTRLNSLSNDLDQSTKYYVRVYAINDYGISYSNEVQLITKFRPDLVEDFDGNIYGLLQIGNQIWMNENLKVTHFRNGAEIPKIEDDNSWSNLSSAAWSNYNNLKQSPYGKLYNWYSTIGDSICPIGWHVPSNEDFSNLINFLGGNEKAKKFLNTPPSSSWHLNETTNNFNAFPAGIRASNGGFWGINEMVNYWSKTETGINNAVMLYLQAENLTLSDLSFVYEFNKNLGSYIRCLKNN